MTSPTMFFFCCYWTIGFPTGLAGYMFLMLSVDIPLYYTILGHVIASMAPTTSIGSL
ncbi:uncharacterized protein F5147DRAFT_689813 [Suillus discolor]|uniref:Uncharacterized protein n=1 Tax=Suillus discolor TaxID=1912936 RepID=A0A9P7F834_9AGAM|nr:uncharacterized protein F5147DRAFT_689813 [Suillus discolor]KAG2110261.1 hypothetical protein F5147DRAFT_689813 [Suillus discolor]